MTEIFTTIFVAGANQGVQQPPGGPAVPGDSLEAASNGAGSSGIGSIKRDFP